jgi:hypothetical protein
MQIDTQEMLISKFKYVTVLILKEVAHCISNSLGCLLSLAFNNIESLMHIPYQSLILCVISMYMLPVLLQMPQVRNSL